MAADFKQIETDLRKDLQLKRKNLLANGDSIRKPEVGSSSISEAFDASSATVETKFRTLFSELSFIKLQLDEKNDQNHVSRRKFEYLDNLACFEEICLILCLGCSSLSSIYNLGQICECLLRYNYGPSAIERLMANFPDQITKVVDRLIENGSIVEEENFVSRKRFDALMKLCRLKPDFKNCLMNKC
uniref:Uncharacterized protein n=1 Tax=Romanomermis culicivorax TaxID=13658 RepID=A0A915K8E8_ROMCU